VKRIQQGGARRGSSVRQSPSRVAGPAAGVARMESLEGRRLMSVVIGLQDGNTLIAVDSTDPRTILATVKVKKGLQKKETLRGIDFRPADNKLYAVGSADRLYTIDVTTGVATAVGTSTFAPPLSGNELGIDFNPVADVLRAESDTGQDVRISPMNGTVIDSDPETQGMQLDGAPTYDAGDANAGKAPALVDIAYTNNDTNAGTATTLFGIDATQDVLVRQGSPDGSPVSPNTGTLFTVGALGIDAGAVGGFDVFTDAGGTNSAFAALTPVTGSKKQQASQLYSINLNAGTASSLGQIGKSKKPTLDLAAPPPGKSFFLIDSKNELLALNTGTPSLVLSKNKVTGLVSKKEHLVGIDFRPADGTLWAFSDAGQLYTINPSSAVATAVGSPSTVPLEKKTSYGFDFNPVADRIRVTNTAQQNLRFDPTTGTLVDFDPATPTVDPDTGLQYVVGDANASAKPRIAGSAYSTNAADAPSTTLYDIDTNRDVLVTQGSAGGTATSPNTGQLFTVGSTGVNVPDQVGFDILTENGTDAAFAVFAPGGKGSTGLYSVNLATGAMTLIGTLNKQVKGVTGFAIQTGP
jgi:hypothetical protein